MEQRAESVSDLRRLGDWMQSEASRVLEWTEKARQKHSTTLEMNYEVEMATIGLQRAIEEWTAARCAEATHDA